MGYSHFTGRTLRYVIDKSVFENVIYIEGQHSIDMSRAVYKGLAISKWIYSHNLVQEKFARLMEFIEVATEGQSYISTKYVTRAWVAFTKK